jgi:hypothetical protein
VRDKQSSVASSEAASCQARKVILKLGNPTAADQILGRYSATRNICRAPARARVARAARPEGDRARTDHL